MDKRRNTAGRGRSSEYESRRDREKRPSDRDNRKSAQKNSSAWQIELPYEVVHRDELSHAQKKSRADINEHANKDPQKSPVYRKKPQGTPPPTAERYRKSGRDAGQNKNAINEKLSSQKTRVRRERQRMRPEELEKLRRENKKQRYYIKQKRKNKIKIFFGRALIVLCMYIVLLPISIGAVYYDATVIGNPNTSNIAYQVGATGASGTRVVYRKYRTIVRNGVFYLDLTEIASLCDFITIGDSKELKYVSRANGEYISVEIGSNLVDVNGTKVRMLGSVYTSGGRVFIPMSFVENYFVGLRAAYISGRRRIIIERVENIADDGSIIYEDVYFKLRAPTVSGSISLRDIGIYE